MAAIHGLIEMLVERGVATTDTREALKCCGMVRDVDGFCQHRSYHPIYIGNYIFEAWGEDDGS